MEAMINVLSYLDIIIPVYNNKEYLGKALDSIVRQTVKSSINVIIVNDGSNYNYNDIIKNYDLNIKEIRLSKNKGVGNARNIGLKNSVNEYVLFLDSDDELYDDVSIEKLLNELVNNPKLNKVAGRVKVFADEVHSLTYLHGLAFKREFIIKNKIKFLNMDIYEDLAFNLAVEILLKDDELLLIEDTIYAYNKNIATSITNRVTDKIIKLNCIIRGIVYALDLAKKNKQYKNINKFTTIIFNDIAYYYFDYILKGKFSAEEEQVLYLKISKEFYSKYKRYINVYKNEIISRYISVLESW